MAPSYLHAAAMRQGAPSELAWLWNKELYSDLTLHICTEQHDAAVPDSGPSRVNGSSPGELGQTTCDPSCTASTSSALHLPAAQREEEAPGSGTAVARPTLPPASSPAHAAPHHGIARTYHLHVAVLASCSTHFKSRTHLADPAPGPLAVAGGPAAHGADADILPAAQELVEHVAPGELDTLELVLRHCYTGDLGLTRQDGGEALLPQADDLVHLPQDGGEAVLDVAAHLQLLTIADRFFILPCVTHILEQLSASASATALPAVLNPIITDLSPHLLTRLRPECGALLAGAKAAAEQRLFFLFGNAEAVCSNFSAPADQLTGQLAGQLAGQLRQLCLPALLLLLRSDALQARSENSVLMMADAWMTGAAGAACSTAERTLVTHALRLGHLSRTFTLDVLPLLQWLQLSPDQRRSLLQFSVAGPARQQRLTQHTLQQHLLICDKALAGPALWYAASPRVAWPGAVDALLTWDVARTDLEDKLEGRPWQAVPPRGFFNGFELQLHFDVGVGRCNFGHTVRVMRMPGETATNQEVDVSAAVSDVNLGVWMPQGGSFSHHKVAGVLFGGLVSTGEQFGTIPRTNVRLINAWDGLMVSTQAAVLAHMRMRCSVTAVE